MDTRAIVLREPKSIDFMRLALPDMGAEDVVVEIEHSGISTGTERLLWSGRMPDFPGMGYPLVPGYESVGRVAAAGPDSGRRVGERVFVPGARCYGEIRGLFGGAASRVVTPGNRVYPLPDSLGEDAVLFALAATAQHAMAPSTDLPDLIVGHGVLGRLLARLAVAAGGRPTVWETNPGRRAGANTYNVIDPADDSRRDYRAIYDVSGDPAILDRLIGCLAPGGEVVLAGFYVTPVSFAFPPAFMKEPRLRIAAEWRPDDMRAVLDLIDAGALSLDGLITHRSSPVDARDAYRTAFEDPDCLKMILDWRKVQ